MHKYVLQAARRNTWKYAQGIVCCRKKEQWTAYQFRLYILMQVYKNEYKNK